MVEGNQETHHGTRVVRKPPEGAGSQETVEQVPSAQGEPQAPAEADHGTYHGAGFSGKRLGKPPPPQQLEPQTSAGRQAGASQAAPPVMYCPSCNLQVQWLPNGQLWCSRCNAAIVVGGGNPIAERLQGFAIGFFFSIIGVIGVAFLSHPSKQGNRVMGAMGGMVFWLGMMWVRGAFDPWLAQYGLNAYACFQVYDGVTCIGPWSPQ